MRRISLSRFFRFSHHYLISTPFYTLNFTTKNKKGGTTYLSNIQFFTHSFLQENISLDTATIKKLEGDKKFIHIVSPGTLFFHKVKLDDKQQTQGIAALISLLKNHFNIDLSGNKVGALDAETGKEIKETATLLPEHTCIFGAENEELDQIQTELITHQFLPQKLNFSVLHVPQGLASYQNLIHSNKPILFVDFSVQHSCIYIVGNRQILAAYPPTYGLKHLVTLNKKESTFQDDITTVKYLTTQIAHEEEKISMLLARMVSDVKTYINFFEIQSNSSIDGIFVNGLLDEYSWIESHLANKLEIKPFSINYPEWLKAENIVLPENNPIPHKALFGMINAVIHHEKC